MCSFICFLILGFLCIARAFGSNLMRLGFVHSCNCVISVWVRVSSLSMLGCQFAKAASSAYTDVLLCAVVLVGMSPV